MAVKVAPTTTRTTRMTSRPAEAISQRQLVFELKHAIDVCLRRPGDSRAAAHLDQLITDNPRGVFSRHVTYNLGKERVHFLWQWHLTNKIADIYDVPRAMARAWASPSSHEATRLAPKEGKAQAPA
jgi:hypothetical protein